MVTIEYICSRNINRSPSYEAVTRDAIEKAGLEGKINVTSSGLDVDRLNRGEFTHDETRFYLKMVLEMELILPKEQYAQFFSKVKEAFRQGSLDAQNLAYKSLLMIDAFCIQKRQEALLSRGIAHIGSQRQTTQREDVNIVIPMSKKYLQPTFETYGLKPIVLPISAFGAEPISEHFELQDYTRVVDLAKEQVPEIVQYALKKANT